MVLAFYFATAIKTNYIYSSNFSFMKKYTLLLATILLSLTFACKDSKKEEKKTQMQEVMAVHDEVMPKMGTIGKLISEINAKIEIIKETDSTLELEDAKKDLQEANKAMMEWMKSFGNRFESDEILKGKALTEEKQKLLNEEEVNVKKVRDLMNKSIENAETILKQ
jgi:preprotein translocase subunit YajC